MVWFRLLLKAFWLNSAFMSLIRPYAPSSPRTTSSRLGGGAVCAADVAATSRHTIMAVNRRFMTPPLYTNARRWDESGRGSIRRRSTRRRALADAVDDHPATARRRAGAPRQCATVRRVRSHALFAILLVVTSAAAADRTVVSLGTATPGGGFPLYGGAIAEAINAEDPTLDVEPRNTKGSTENVPVLAAGTLH